MTSHSDIVARTEDENDKRDAVRYRWLRDRQHSLESEFGVETSCYHVVGGVRELKSGVELDEAVNAAIDQAAKAAADIEQLKRFYSVDTLERLVLRQAQHVERLQAKLPDIAHFSPQKVREG